MKTFNALSLAFGLCSLQPAFTQCEINLFLVHGFYIGDTQYHLVKENRTWQQAAECATSRGGRLAEINSQAEQNLIFENVNNAFIDPTNTVAMDGGGASYIWIGGNDSALEGTWVWDGNNDGQSSPFWIGTASGSAVNGSFENWGNEPDNWNGQDGLGLAITDWMFGEAGQWNDIFLTNELYYIIEYPSPFLDVQENTVSMFDLWPNPTTGQLNVSLPQDATVIFTDVSGKTALSVATGTGVTAIDISTLPSGMYLVRAGTEVRRLIVD